MSTETDLDELVRELRDTANCTRMGNNTESLTKLLEAAATTIERLRPSTGAVDKLPGALALANAVREGKWPHTMDAQVWAQAFLDHFPTNMIARYDESTMIGWFANAIMAGYDTAQARAALATPPTAQGDAMCGSEQDDEDSYHDRIEFEAAWKAIGYNYGADELESVRLGWDLARRLAQPQVPEGCVVVSRELWIAASSALEREQAHPESRSAEGDREAFERDMIKRQMYCARDEQGDYVSPDVYWAWQVWQAALAYRDGGKK